MHAIVHRAINLPDTDSSLRSLSDSFVKFSVGATVAKSSVMDDNLNPVRRIMNNFGICLGAA